MKKTFFLAGFLVLLFLFANLRIEPAYAGWLDWIKEIQKKKPVQVEKAPPKKELTPEELKVEKKANELQAKEELNKKEWTIYLVSANPKKTKLETDVIKFSGGRVLSVNLSDKGYSESNYSLSIEPDGTIVWETMQGQEKLGRAFWRGELRGEVMQGILTLQSKKGDNEDLYFTTIVPPEKPEEKPALAEPVKKKKK
jgi:hypothetical protein